MIFSMINTYLVNLFILVLLVVLSFSQVALAWSTRGHHIICEAASFLVKEPELKKFLSARPHVMGHLCSVPDIHWKGMGQSVSQIGDPTHYIDPEIIGLKILDIPTDFQEIRRQYEGNINAAKKEKKIISVAAELGSSWWRADQFYRRAVESGKILKSPLYPQNRLDEQSEKLPYNRAVYEWFVNLGLMGHFVGDMGQPLHTTLDYDGYGRGHGGIHTFYEDAVVAAQDFQLTSDVVKAAQRLRPTADFLKGSSVLERMKSLTQLSHEDISQILRLDPIIKKSEERDEKGMSLKNPAQRKDADLVASKYRPLLVKHMARSAALLARFWDEAYEAIGKPKLTFYKSYRYPFQPDFIPPDYIEPQSKKLEK